MNSNILEKAIVEMVRSHRFYSKVILKLKRVQTTEIPTMAVDIKNGATLYINPYFFNAYSPQEQVAFLIHEIMHLAFDHGARILELEPEHFKIPKTFEEILDRMTKPSNWNIATDTAINQLIQNLPAKLRLFDKKGDPVLEKDGSVAEFEACTLDTMRKKIPHLKALQSAEYYYHELQKYQKENPEEGQGEFKVIILDNHDALNSKEGGELPEELQKEIIKNIFNEAARESAASEIPKEMQDFIHVLNSSKKNWVQDLSIFVSTCAAVEIESTKRRKNRRYGWQYPGVRYEPKLTLAVAIDESGSVRDEEYVQFMAEIAAIYELGVNIVVIHCDTQINLVQKYEGTPLNRTSSGGTCFKPVFDLLESSEFTNEYGEVDGLIYLTDGENWDTDSIYEPDYEVLWALMPGCQPKYSWGSRTEVVINE
jgi:predicted metal-dependent peptidase